MKSAQMISITEAVGFVFICHPYDSRLPAKISAIDAFEKKLRYQLL
ncbi:hypothetical protein HanXRQr2_Chr09g0400031 [Helianthus annuus]|uniref:Uncharacterized protein n=1 Tax=Helianthus annuus TaxID=4232 RepID=A0A9K3N9S4_HELAN|nr:hypothetical protein HanXRQr2_Chr09g0400031 [Helianthus annuus]KAJ0894143.1 hypothetical protein HanPSC8_Chr09g0385771 [Helianthus annuus]